MAATVKIINNTYLGVILASIGWKDDGSLVNKSDYFVFEITPGIQELSVALD